jgi:hypothetical protein
MHTRRLFRKATGDGDGHMGVSGPFDPILAALTRSKDFSGVGAATTLSRRGCASGHRLRGFIRFIA